MIDGSEILLLRVKGSKNKYVYTLDPNPSVNSCVHEYCNGEPVGVITESHFRDVRKYMYTTMSAKVVYDIFTEKG